MCRSIKKLRRADEVPTDEELFGAARQFIRKISGFNAPSRANQEAFEAAIAEVMDASRRLFGRLNSTGSRVPPKESAR